MKKPILLSVLIAASSVCLAQVQLGVFAGPQVSSVKYTINDVKQSANLRPGFQAGVTVKIPFDDHLFFAPAAFYSLKGYKVKFNLPSYPPDTTAIDNKTTIHTFEVAALLQYDLGNQPDHFFIKSGLSIDGQIAGHEQYTLKTGGSISRKMPFNFGEYGYAGANFLVLFGFETKKGLMIFGQYTYGIGSINNADEGPKIRHRAIGISIGKYFIKK